MADAAGSVIAFEAKMARLERELRRTHIVTSLSIFLAAVIFIADRL